ncbi:ankyrin repeat-containing domain protein [Fomitopsis serialis]|uniref:ankyrin repeat-containing domain protein n=1 Tax=Fomitopsis serialis TaxID=139415 RepID=UPI002007FB0C|nr:ankyrin repeat-containing domain protein [Neoantrodia serialis]KAH9928602.1 ankyrin repeat-containing domain protein [Neoantrodia serialis]
MPVPTRVRYEKNIWVAAGDGDLERVRVRCMLMRAALSANIPDENTYTPMHAAASYGQLHVLDYLVSKGGDVNITDNDGDTPLYVVENIETARWLVEHGATVERQNSEGISPAQYLEEDFPEVAAYLHSLTATTDPASAASSLTQPSQHAQNLASEHLTSSLIQSVQDVMQRAEAEGRNPDEELRQVVGRTVLEGVVTGYGMSTLGGQRRENAEDGPTEGPKRTRMDDGNNGQG